MRAGLRAGHRGVVSVFNVSFVVDRADHRVPESAVEVQQSLGRIARRYQRIVKIPTDLFNLLDTLPLLVVVRRWNLTAADFREVVNACELQQGRDAVEKAHKEKPVERRCVTNLRQISARIERNRRKREDSCDAETNPVACCLAMNPERYPRQDDNENARNIDL